MQIYLVGGAVRDQLLGYPVYDKDWVVVGATPNEMIEQGFQPVGADFPVFIHPENGEEYALARTERKSGKGYTGFQYHASPGVTLEQDLIRRDLTINAMAMDDNGTLHDPYHGAKDLKLKLLRHVSPAFTEDPLRVLRVARFAARYHHLGFSVAEETLALMAELAASDELEHLTPERIWKEFERALGEQSPEVFLALLQGTTATNKVFPEIQPTLTETLLARFQQVSKKADSSLLRFACLIALCNTAIQQIDIAAFCDRLKTPKAFKELAQQCSQHHASLAQFDQLTAEDKLNTLQSLDFIRRPQRIESLIACTEALHEHIATRTLQPILAQIAKISPKALMQSGFSGPALGQEIEQQRLLICQAHTQA